MAKMMPSMTRRSWRGGRKGKKEVEEEGKGEGGCVYRCCLSNKSTAMHFKKASHLHQTPGV
jgi:hypothetical protein